ncbi:hypothetical protein [Aridibaculum aurantiacum]|uniref:hypothetical protein n=1 Tax=Aridibaculum aurantiacum TaxID=2810307 RepID=UPI001A978644|nr:hypothetical protein [Aridibaculum aurantiacum]
MRQSSTAGILLIFAAVTYFASWALMPDQGTADTAHILSIVQQERQWVLASVIVQIISSVLYIPALFLMVHALPFKGPSLVGVVLLAIGAMGMCADAFFHLLAYFMTDDAVHMKEGVVQVMTSMQTKGLRFLVPLLLPFFVGTTILADGLRRLQIVSRLPLILATAAFLVAMAGGLLVNKVLGYGRGTLVLLVLAMFGAAQVAIGANLLRRSVQASFISAARTA